MGPRPRKVAAPLGWNTGLATRTGVRTGEHRGSSAFRTTRPETTIAGVNSRHGLITAGLAQTFPVPRHMPVGLTARLLVPIGYSSRVRPCAIRCLAAHAGADGRPGFCQFPNACLRPLNTTVERDWRTLQANCWPLCVSMRRCHVDPVRRVVVRQWPRRLDVTDVDDGPLFRHCDVIDAVLTLGLERLPRQLPGRHP